MSSPLVARSTPPAQAHHPLDYSRVGVGLLEQGVRIEGRGDKPVFLALNLKPLTNQRLKKDQQPCEKCLTPHVPAEEEPHTFPRLAFALPALEKDPCSYPCYILRYYYSDEWRVALKSTNRVTSCTVAG